MSPSSPVYELERIAALYARLFGANGRRGRGRPRKPRYDRYGLPIHQRRARGRPPATTPDRLARLETVWTWYALVCLRWEAHRRHRSGNPAGYQGDADRYPRGWTSPRARALCDVALTIGASPVTVRDAIRVERRMLARDPRFRAIVPAFNGQHATHAFVWRTEDMIFPAPLLVRLGDVFTLSDAST